jgi:hypothetical protein
LVYLTLRVDATRANCEWLRSIRRAEERGFSRQRRKVAKDCRVSKSQSTAAFKAAKALPVYGFLCALGLCGRNHHSQDSNFHLKYERTREEYVSNAAVRHSDDKGGPSHSRDALRPAQATPQHLLELPGGEWALWRWVALRGAGFPADGVLKLSAPDAAVAADLLLSIEARLQSERAATMSLFDSELTRLNTCRALGGCQVVSTVAHLRAALMRYDNSPQLKSPELQPEERAVAAEMKEAVERGACGRSGVDRGAQ